MRSRLRPPSGDASDRSSAPGSAEPPRAAARRAPQPSAPQLFPPPKWGPSAAPASALSERDAELTRLAHEVAEHVQRDTGWPIDTTRLRVEALSGYACLDRVDRDGARRAAAVEEKRRLGARAPELARELVADLHPTIPRSGSVSARIQDGIRDASALATYLASEGTIVVNEVALRKLNRSGVAHLLHHELFHAAQDQNFPKFMYEDALRPRLAAATSPLDPVEDARESTQARMTLAESHARCVDVAAHAARYPDSNLPHFRMAPAHLLFRRNMAGTQSGEAMNAKGAQYAAHAVIQSLLGRPDGPFLIRQLYADPKLTDLLFKRRGTVHIEGRESARPFGRDGLLAVVRLLRESNPHPEARHSLHVVVTPCGTHLAEPK